MEPRIRSMAFAFVFALGAGLAGCQAGYDEEPEMQDSGSQTGAVTPPTGGGAGSPSGTTDGGGGGGGGY